MKTFGALCVGFITLIMSYILNAIVWNCVYILGVMPLCAEFGVALPDISFWMFVVASAIISTVRPINTQKSYTIDSAEFWKTFLGGWVTKFINVAILWVLHIIIF